MEQLRNKDTRPMMDLVAKKVFNNTEVTAEFIRDLLDLPVVNLIKKGIITKEDACEELGVSVQELEKHL